MIFNTIILKKNSQRTDSLPETRIRYSKFPNSRQQETFSGNNIEKQQA